MKHTLSLAMLGIVLSGSAMAATNTVDWYVAHADERKARIAACDNDPGDLQDDPDCINARAAGKQAAVDTAKDKLDNAGGRMKDAWHDLTK